MKLLAWLGLLLAPIVLTALAPRPEEPRLSSVRGKIALAELSWLHDGVESGAVERGEEGDALLNCERLGERWAFVFHTETAGAARLFLDARLDERGLVIEFVIDGERLSPARDLWRPESVREIADLGTRWFGAGEHLVEIVTREAGPGRLQLRSLELRDPGEL